MAEDTRHDESLSVDPAWRRLGVLLRLRRERELGVSRKALAARFGVSDRNIRDIEQGSRDNYLHSTLATFEHLYGLAPGAIRHVLDGGDLVLAGGKDLSPDREYDHPQDQALWELSAIPEATRRLLITVNQGERARIEKDSDKDQRTG